MKVHIELDMTPEEARAMMGLPDLQPLQKQMLEDMRGRMKAAMEAGDMDAVMRAWMPLGGAEAFTQFQKFLWDSAGMVARGGKPKDRS
jgi:hypothetical protein